MTPPPGERSRVRIDHVPHSPFDPVHSRPPGSGRQQTSRYLQATPESVKWRTAKSQRGQVAVPVVSSGSGSPPARVARTAMAIGLPGPTPARTSLLRPADRGRPPSPSSAVSARASASAGQAVSRPHQRLISAMSKVHRRCAPESRNCSLSQLRTTEIISRKPAAGSADELSGRSLREPVSPMQELACSSRERLIRGTSPAGKPFRRSPPGRGRHEPAQQTAAGFSQRYGPRRGSTGIRSRWTPRTGRD